MDVVVATVLDGVRERRREGLKTVAEVVNIVVVMKHKSVVVVGGYKTEAMIGSGGSSKKQIDGGGMLGCTDTPFLASCPCPTRVGHRNGYDAPDSGVRQCLFLFFFS